MAYFFCQQTRVSYKTDKSHPLWNHWNAFAIFRIVLPQKSTAKNECSICTVWQFHNLMSYQLSFDYAIYFSNEFNRSIQNQRLIMTLKLTRFCALVLSKTPKRIKEKMLKFEWKSKFWIENSATKKYNSPYCVDINWLNGVDFSISMLARDL